MNPYKVCKDPCSSCPYRRDTPSGVWDKTEYEKLPSWDEQWGGRGVFLCHQADAEAEQKTLCRGWLEVHHRNITVRMATFRTDFNGHPEPTKVPLYSTGAQAKRAGLRAMKKPSAQAKLVIKKIVAKRAAR